MAHVVIGVKKEFVSKVPEILKDDLVGRQSIVTRDAAALDMKSELHLVVIEGSEAGVARAKEIFKDTGEPLAEKEALEVLQKIKEQEEKASVGVGMIFDA
jgi:Zn-finger domain-containing protein